MSNPVTQSRVYRLIADLGLAVDVSSRGGFGFPFLGWGLVSVGFGYQLVDLQGRRPWPVMTRARDVRRMLLEMLAGIDRRPPDRPGHRISAHRARIRPGEPVRWRCTRIRVETSRSTP